jgi:hypothetical protein
MRRSILQSKAAELQDTSHYYLGQWSFPAFQPQGEALLLKHKTERARGSSIISSSLVKRLQSHVVTINWSPDIVRRRKHGKGDMELNIAAPSRFSLSCHLSEPKTRRREEREGVVYSILSCGVREGAPDSALLRPQDQSQPTGIQDVGR